MASALPKMKYTRLGKTGLKVSRICLGCMSYGSSKWQPWVKDEAESMDMIKRAYDAGINFFDTADTYSNGESERILGKAIKKFCFPRSKIVVATKCFFPVHPTDPSMILFRGDPDELGFINGHGLSRKHIFDAVDQSLERLGLDYIDLYQIHRWDYNTPIEETMEALHDVVKSGKVRYIGASSMYTWQFAKANSIAEQRGWTKFVSMQNLYNLLYREEEREMIPYCLDQGIGLIPWSPLARGILTAKNRQTVRAETDMAQKLWFQKTKDQDSTILDRVVEVAEKKGISAAQVAVAWLWTKPAVAAPILGIGKPSHLEDLIRALDVELTEEEINYLEDVYQPKPIVGHL